MSRDRLRLISERWLSVKLVFKRFRRLWRLNPIQEMHQAVKKFRNVWLRWKRCLRNSLPNLIQPSHAELCTTLALLNAKQ